MLHYNRWDCDSLRSLHKFGLAKNPALYLRFWSLYSKLHKFALAKSEIWTLTYRTIGFSSIATDTKRKGSLGLEPTRCRHQRILSPSRLPFHHTGAMG